MEKDFIFTQVKETIMTMDKTVTKITERLEAVDAFGHKKCVKSSHSEVEYHQKGFGIGRAA